MSKEPKDIKAIFSEALEKQTAEERAAYLDEACGNDADLRSKVEALLKAHNEAGDFLEVPALGPDVNADESPSIEGPGTRIGRYELLELIGEGGMGLVYLAEQQEPVRRNLALKIVKLGMDTKQVIARFEAERQTLAVLDHPNIAHVFDAGTTEAGRPYFVMEYVEGMSITKYCDEHKLNIEERLELFKQVCEGVHHAHQKGIIHRDIKPSNILVSNHGDKAVPKIIDFGIAKAITQPLTEETFFTHEGQLLGTPEYMSPEQVDMATQDIDTRSDIYSLGVLLYVLLAGVLPFDRESLEHAGFAELQRTIREDEPPLPSTRLTSLGDKAKAIAESRRTQIITLTRRLHRELEWIPMKAMRKDRTRRYRSASELADDIQNYLNGTPLIAGPESTVYRARKFVRKHAGSVATVVLVAVLIILGLIVSTALSFRAENAREKEAAARTQAEQAYAQAEQARDKEAAARAQVEEALARAENAERIAQEQRKLAEERAEDYRRALYFNRISLAEVAYRNSNMNRSRELLDSCPEDLRAWEWYRLNHITGQSCMTLCAHSGPVSSVGFSPDGKYIVSGSDDQTIKLWDAANGAELMTLREHDSPVWSVAFSPDSRRIISSDKGGTIRMWDTVTSSQLMTLRGHSDEVYGLAFSPDGKHIVSGSDDQTIKVWNAATGTELITIRGHERKIGPVSFSPDGSKIVSGSMDNTIKLWNTATGAEVMTLRGHTGWIWAVTFSPDGKRIVSGSHDGTIKVWDGSTGAEVMTLSGHKRAVLDVAFSPDGRQIVSGSNDGAIKVWDGSNGAEVMTLRGHSGRVSSVAFSPDGERIISGSSDNTIKVWDVAIDRERTVLAGPQGGEGRVGFSPDGSRIISLTGTDGLIKVWDAATGTEQTTLRGRRHGFLSAAFSPDGKRIVSGSMFNTVKVWDTATGIELMSLRGHNGWVVSVAFSPDGKRIISGSWDGTIKLWDATTAAELIDLRGHEPFVTSVAFSPDGERIVSGSFDKTIKLWDAANGAELMTLREHDSPVWSVAFSPDSKCIVSGSENGKIKVWCAVSGKELVSVQGHTSRLRSVAFSPDGTRMISASHDGTLKVWDAATGVEVMTLRGYGSAVFSPDGKTIAFGTTLLEATAPPNGYGPRRTGAVARKLVDELYEEHGFYSKAIDELKADEMLGESVRKVALQIANARLCEDARKLCDESGIVVVFPGGDIKAYQLALEKAQKADLLESNHPYTLTVLGAAHYRLGAYEEALVALRRSEKIIIEVQFDVLLRKLHPPNTAFIVMSLYQLGRTEEAQAALGRLQNLCKDKRFIEDKIAQVLLTEAEKLFAD